MRFGVQHLHGLTKLSPLSLCNCFESQKPPTKYPEGQSLSLYVQELHGLTKLSSLSLCNCFDVDGPAVVLLAAHLPALSHLNLQHCVLFDAELHKLVQVTHQFSLQKAAVLMLLSVRLPAWDFCFLNGFVQMKDQKQTKCSDQLKDVFRI